MGAIIEGLFLGTGGFEWNEKPHTMSGYKSTVTPALYKLFARPALRFTKINQILGGGHTVFNIERPAFPSQLLYELLPEPEGPRVIHPAYGIWNIKLFINNVFV